MKRAILLLSAVVLLAGLSGCAAQRGSRPSKCTGGSCAQAPENCQACAQVSENCQACDQASENCQSCENFDNGGDPGRLRCRDCGGRGCGRCRAAESGPPTGTVTYPYYTTRGPRDFLAKNPRSIGP
jgi:hypothetical protein